MRKPIIGTAVLAAGACAVCCAPLVAAPVVAIFAAGGATLALFGQVALALGILTAGGGYLWWRNRARRRQLAAASCGCGPSEGCNSAEAACALPPPAPRT